MFVLKNFSSWTSCSSQFSIISRNFHNGVNEARSVLLHLGSEWSDDEGWEDGFEATMSHDAASCASLHLRGTSRVAGFAHSTDWSFVNQVLNSWSLIVFNSISVNCLLIVRDNVFLCPCLVCRWPHCGLRLMTDSSLPRILNGA